MSDAHALEQLGVLLDLPVTERGGWLAKLAVQDPAIHSRLVRLLQAAVAGDGSGLLRAHVPSAIREALEVPALNPDQIVAGYRLIEEIGRGGMAVVWRAERADGVVRRSVALKLPLFLSRSADELSRFAREKDALAALNHPNIAQLHDAGVASTGQPFIALEFVAGEPLTRYCDARSLGIPARLTLFLDVLAAVEHAHRHLIVHRDLKPSNILVDADGHVKLLDFGIAKMLDGAAIGAGAVLTEYGNVALTPRYAAPEQVTGKPISTLTDVFVLGVLLHELLTGKLPYAHAVGDAPSLAQMVAALTRGESSRPSAAPLTDEAATLRALPTASRLAATLRGDLDTIVKKALSPDPAARYGSAGEMANDIRSFLARKPIAARPASRWYATRLLLLRHRAVGIAAGLGLMAVLGAGAVAWRNHLDSRMYEERGIAVRDFMRDLVNDSEPSETQPDAPVTFNDMIDSSVRRARVDYSTQPVLQGELLSELGRMYWVLGRSDASLPVLAEAVDLLERNTTDDDPALNKARTYLASELLERNETGRAKDLASRALEFCRRDNRDCARARANANSLLSRLAFIDGQTESALALHRRALEETRRAYGTRHSETVLAMQALATALRNSGHLTEASALIVQATDLAGSITLKKIDRTILLRTAALLDMDLGRYQAAERRLTKLIGTTTAREERALLLRLLANTALALGEPARALDAANEAIALALTDQIDIEGLFAKQSRAQARSLLESYPEAFADIDAVLAGLRAVGYAEHSYELLRARRIRAEVQLRAGEIVPAARELEGLLKRHEALGVPVSSEWGLALDLFGCTQRELGESTEAGAIHRRAATQLEKQLPADHPFRLRNTLYQLAAAEERGEFERLARSLQGGLPPNSLWLQLVDVRRGNRSCRDVGRKSCVFVL